MGKQSVLIAYHNKGYGSFEEVYPDLHAAEDQARRCVEGGTAIRRAVILEGGESKCVLTPMVTVKFRVEQPNPEQRP